MSYGNTRRPYRKKKDYTPIVLAVVMFLALPALAFAVYKFVLNKPASTPEEIAVAVVPPRNIVSSNNATTRPATIPATTGTTARAANTTTTTTPANTGPTDPFAMADMMGMMNADVATAKVCKKLKESMELRKTLAIWLFDRSPSADGRREEVLKHLQTYYPLLKVPGQAPAADPAAAQLVSVVGGFAADASFVTQEPEADSQKFLSAVAQIKSGSDGNIENTFKAIEAAVTKFGTYAEPPHLRNVAVIVVTDEIGNDQVERDKVTALVQKSTIPVYVIGAAAPFGGTGAMAAGPEGSQFAQGPETRDVEWVNIESGMGPIMMGNQETNFGPYSLTALCRESGGEMFPIASLGGGMNLPPQYAPRYMSEKDYQALVAGNKALSALIAAAKLPAAKQISGPETSFGVDEAGSPTTADVDKAQRPQALIKPSIDAVYDLLKEGEKDRPKLTDPRQQAAFDLAMGRIMAAKVRTEGYIVLLAAFKSGRKATKPDTRLWRLEMADGIEKNSVLDSMAKKARQYLEKVIAEHPNTPWANAAQQELALPIGWKWIES
ncbi:MAG: hypothetical protein J0M17_17895 [Planctomycetes bacterium]|nr:hypothetical protein [Planctomycetota bacterium]